MGATVSTLSQSSISYSSLMKSYQLVQKNQQKSLTIVKEKQSSNFYLIKELIFAQKSEYQKHLCRFNHFQSIEQSQNILKLQKVWTEQQNTLCSNTYKIYPMYETSNVTLKDELDARRVQNKYFDQNELLGIVQAGLNSLNSQSPIIFSPEEYFVCIDGLLKVNNFDLFDKYKLESYMPGVYYSPQKMEHFDDSSLIMNADNFLKQSIFSLGLTLLSCVFLEDLSLKLYNPLNSNKKLRFDYCLLQNLVASIRSNNNLIFQKLIDLIETMLVKNLKLRPNLNKIQSQLDQIANLREESLIAEDQNISMNKYQHQDAYNQNENNLQQKYKNININPITIAIRHNNIDIIQSRKKITQRMENISTIFDKNIKSCQNNTQNKVLTENSQLQMLKEIMSTSNQNIKNNININQIHYQNSKNESQEKNKRNISDNRSNSMMNFKFNVPLISSKDLYTNQNDEYCQTKQFNFSGNTYVEQLPSPIDQINPIFTNPQFLQKINHDIKHFTFTRKPSFASTQISRKNSYIHLLEKQNSWNVA